MVTSIDEMGRDIVPTPSAPHPNSRFDEALERADATTDQYAEAELKLRHQRTERIIEKAARDLT